LAAVAVKPHEVVAERTKALEASFYELLGVCDAYRTEVTGLIAAEREAPEPRPQLIHRLEQMAGRMTRIIAILEDDVLSEMLPMIDRLFALERAERGEDI
jgi:hypothetical protein